ncbi:MAG: UDP binding domain-containing protein, partial [Bacteroidota bacterium]
INKITAEVRSFTAKNNSKPKVACLGLAFKPNIDDLRESPALHIVEDLIKRGVDVLAVEPYAKEFEQFDLYDTQDALAQADIVVLLVKHNSFETLKFKKPVLDFCGVLVK